MRGREAGLLYLGKRPATADAGWGYEHGAADALAVAEELTVTFCMHGWSQLQRY